MWSDISTSLLHKNIHQKRVWYCSRQATVSFIERWITRTEASDLGFITSPRIMQPPVAYEFKLGDGSLCMGMNPFHGNQKLLLQMYSLMDRYHCLAVARKPHPWVKFEEHMYVDVFLFFFFEKETDNRHFFEKKTQKHELYSWVLFFFWQKNHFCFLFFEKKNNLKNKHKNKTDCILEFIFFFDKKNIISVYTFFFQKKTEHRKLIGKLTRQKRFSIPGYCKSLPNKFCVCYFCLCVFFRLFYVFWQQNKPSRIT